MAGIDEGIMHKIDSYKTWRDEDGDEIESRSDDFPCEPDEIDREEGLTAVDLAVKVITERLYVHEPSSSPGFHPGMWYSRSDEPDQLSPAGSYVEETSGHLKGFTPDEERAVWEKLREQRWLTA